MKLLLLLSCVVATQAGITRRDASCDGPIINGVHYTDEKLQDDLEQPCSLSLELKTNTLYYTVGNYNHAYKTVKFDLNTKEFTVLTIIESHNGIVNSVDQQTGEVYLGGEHGIFKYSKATGKTEFIGANGTDIWGLFYKDGVVYYTDYTSCFAYTIVNGVESRFEDLKHTTAKDILIDNNDTIFFTNDTSGTGGVYSRTKGTKGYDIYYKGSRGIYIRSLTMNSRGDVFAATEDGIYEVDKLKQIIRLILPVNDSYGVVFDGNDNIIYSDPKSIHWVKRSDKQQCV